MSIELITDVYKRDMPAKTQRVLLAICDHANDDGICWPSIGKIAWKLGLSERTIERAIVDLETDKAISVRRVNGRANRYKIDLSVYPLKAKYESRRTRQATPKPPDKLSDVLEKTTRQIVAPTTRQIVVPPPDKLSPITVRETPVETTAHAVLIDAKPFGVDDVPVITDSPVLAPTGRPTVNARWSRLFDVFATAKRLTSIQKSADRRRAFGEFKRVLPTHELIDLVDVDRFAQTVRSMMMTTPPEYVWPTQVLSKMEQSSADAAVDVSKLIDAYFTRLRAGDFMAPHSRSDVALAMTRIVTEHPDIEPKHIIWATAWAWRRDNRPPEPKRMPFVVRDWYADGAPEVRRNRSTVA